MIFVGLIDGGGAPADRVPQEAIKEEELGRKKGREKRKGETHELQIRDRLDLASDWGRSSVVLWRVIEEFAVAVCGLLLPEGAVVIQPFAVELEEGQEQKGMCSLVAIFDVQEELMTGQQKKKEHQ